MPEESVRRAKLFTDGVALAFRTIDALFTDEEPDRAAWATLREEAEAELRAGVGAAGDAPEHANVAPFRLLVWLGSTVAASTMEELDAATASKPSDEEHTTMAMEALGVAILVKRRLEIEPPAPAHARHAYALTLANLLPVYARSRDRSAKALRKVLEEHQRAFESGASSPRASGAFCALAEALADRHGEFDFLAPALAWGETALEGARPSDELMLSNNLAGTCLQLGAIGQGDARVHFERGLSLASRAEELLRGPDLPEAMREAHPELITNSLMAQALLHARLVAAAPERSSHHAQEAYRVAVEREAIIRKLGDLDAASRAAALTEAIVEMVREVIPTWAPPANDSQMDGLKSDLAERYVDRVGSHRDDATRIVAMTDPDAQRGALGEALERWYEGLTSSLLMGLRDVGFTNGFCRCLLALGAIASGRAGQWTEEFVIAWIMRSIDSSQRPEDVNEDAWAHQRAPSASWHDSLRIIQHIHGIATAADLLREVPALRSFLAERMHQRNAELVRSLIKNGPVGLLDAPRSSAECDLHAFFQGIPADFIPEALTAYNPARSSAKGGAGPRGRFPMTVRRDSRRRRIDTADNESLTTEQRVKQATEFFSAMAAEVSAVRDADDKPRALRHYMDRLVEVSKQVGLGPFPRMDLELDPADEARLGVDWLETQPETLVGSRVRLGGVPHDVVGVLGQGTTKVVFDLVNVETQKKIALPMFRSQPQERLFEEANRLLTEDYDPDQMIAVCEKILRRDPNNEHAAFNEGIAYLHKDDPVRAISCLDRALRLKPNDWKNWLFKAVALSLLGRHGDAALSLARAASLDERAIREQLLSQKRLVAPLSWSVDALLALNPEHELLKQLRDLLDLDSNRSPR